MHISKINELQGVLESITQEQYNSMFAYYETVKHLFELEGMSNQIIHENTRQINNAK
jgi:hemoglobin-like flavoprotein